MWVFDGEEWTEESGSDQPRTSDKALPRYEESMPELQVIEYVPTTVVELPWTGTDVVPPARLP